MRDFALLDKLAELAKEKRYPMYRMAMYCDGEIREKVIAPSSVCHDIYSVSKNFITTACGICIDEGWMDYDTTVWDLFHDERPEMNPLWKDVTAEIVMSQTVGIRGMFLDIDTEDAFSWPEADWLDRVLNHPFVYRPGEKFAYSDSNFYLVSRMVAKAAGRPAQDLLAERLFLPLKMQGWAWATCPRGHAMGGTGLFIRTVDMAKLGALYMDGGVYDGVRVLSESFAWRATHPISHPNDHEDYGLSFWLPKGDLHGVFRGSGAFNQGIWTDPTDRFVLAWHAFDDDGTMGDFRDKIRSLR